MLKREGIECIVAPYEADAQLAYLALTGDVDAVITEDSDLLPYGCPTASVWRVASSRHQGRCLVPLCDIAASK